MHHMGFIVPNVDEAVSFFETMFGAGYQVCFTDGQTFVGAGVKGRKRPMLHQAHFGAKGGGLN